LKTLDEIMKNPRIRGIGVFLIDHEDSITELAKHTRYSRDYLYFLMKDLEQKGLVLQKKVIGEKGKYNAYQTSEIGKRYLKLKGYRIESIGKDMRQFLSEVEQKGALIGVKY